MRVVIFCHSLVSDWSHGNAHFLRGVTAELQARGHDVNVWEPANGWSRQNLVREHGAAALEGFQRDYPGLRSRSYELATLDLDLALEGADLVLDHEWNDHDLVRRIGQHRARGAAYKLLFHDTHHRSATDPASAARYDLRHYDGVLAVGEAIRERYQRNGWARRAWTWHEAADTRVFRPHPEIERTGDLVWVGNWGDDERTAELQEFMLTPVRTLRLKATGYGVRYPSTARRALADSGMQYEGWLPNHDVPLAFARHRVTVHVPRRHYVAALPGIPTIRPFEALACGIPLVTSPWRDVEGLFSPGEDFLVARSALEMVKHLRALLADEGMARDLATRGRAKIFARHTCTHRVNELLAIDQSLRI
jgi:spore maturation protein CgeB